LVNELSACNRTMVSLMSQSTDLARSKVVGVVDNDAGMLKALERLLTAHGFVVEPYVSAEAFLDGAIEDELTCLVLDIHLGGMSGIQLHRQLSASGWKLPVIFVTAFDNPDTEREAVDAGCVAYLLKPFPASSLIGAINAATR
jgi:FixJ family two-component response regulator